MWKIHGARPRRVLWLLPLGGASAWWGSQGARADTLLVTAPSEQIGDEVCPPLHCTGPLSCHSKQSGWDGEWENPQLDWVDGRKVQCGDRGVGVLSKWLGRVDYAVSPRLSWWRCPCKQLLCSPSVCSSHFSSDLNHKDEIMRQPLTQPLIFALMNVLNAFPNLSIYFLE